MDISISLLPAHVQIKIDPEDSGCWLWNAYCSVDGYGRLKSNGQAKMSHRVVYEYFLGPIPDGLQIDHLCRVRRCVNPDHLEPVTVHENSIRSNSFAAVNARKTHCIHGHPFDQANTYREARGRRLFRACRLASDHKRNRLEAALRAVAVTGGA